MATVRHSACHSTRKNLHGVQALQVMPVHLLIQAHELGKQLLAHSIVYAWTLQCSSKQLKKYGVAS